MNTITISRPKGVDLEKLFNVKLHIIPGFDGVAVLPAKEIIIGTSCVVWIAGCSVATNGATLQWSDKKQWCKYLSGQWYVLDKGGSLVINIKWDE